MATAYAGIFGESTRTVDPVRILSATHLTVFKALFSRTKDWADIEEMLTFGAVEVDRVGEWLKRLVGAGDERLARLTAAQEAARRDGPPATFRNLTGGND